MRPGEPLASQKRCTVSHTGSTGTSRERRDRSTWDHHSSASTNISPSSPRGSGAYCCANNGRSMARPRRWNVA
eukprot:11198125-Alexandrium_andersonii.AAC.1